jgi:hypothetical protein
VVEDVVGVVLGLHSRQPVVDGVPVRLANPAGLLVGAEEVDVDAVAEAVEGGEEAPRPGDVLVAMALAGPPHGVERDGVRDPSVPERGVAAGVAADRASQVEEGHLGAR